MVTPVNVGAAMRRGRVARRDEVQRQALQEAERANVQRQQTAREALVDRFGVEAGDPVAFGQLRGMDRADRTLDMREQEFEASQEQQQRDQFAQNAQRLGALTAQRIQNGADPVAAFDSVTPILTRGFDMDPQRLAALRAAVVENPQQAPQLLASLGGVEPQQDFTPRGSPGEFMIGGQRVFGQPGIDAQGNFTVRPAEGVREARDPTANRPRARGGPIRVVGRDGREQTVIPMADGSFVQAPFSLPDEEEDSAEARKQRAGQERLTGILEGVTQTYLTLFEGGNVPAAGQPLGANIRARAGATGIGRSIRQTMGDPTGAQLQTIADSQPLLLAAVKDAAGLSGRAMDSNRELEFYLQAATNPSNDFFANMAAIDALDKTFGMGGVLQSQLPPETYARVEQISGRMLSERPIPPLRAADGSTEDTVETRLGLDPEEVEEARRDGGGQLRQRASTLGVSMDDVLFTAEQEDLTPAEVLDELENRRGQ